MKPPTETVRVSQRGKEILTRLKVKTGIEHWNVLCRWALCASLQAENAPQRLNAIHDSNIEMTWKTFAGPMGDALAATVMMRAKSDHVDLSDGDAVARYFRAHLERGIGKLQAGKTLDDFVSWLPTNGNKQRAT
jgi:DNA sulfur modification protein DndE